MINLKSSSKCDRENLQSLHDARLTIANNISAIEGTEYLNLKSSLGRILAKDIQSPIDVPSFRNSAMDGYAFNGNEIPKSGIKSLQIAGTSWAGAPFRNTLIPGQCARIFTGAVIPNGCDTVVMQEEVTQENGSITISSNIVKGDNTRLPGEDINFGQMILKNGKRLGAAELGILASVGISSVPVKPKVRVAYFSTGDELISLGSQLKTGEIYDSNRYILHGLLARIGAEIEDLGVVKDDPCQLKAALLNASECSDVVITTGGASVGDKDYLRGMLEELGEIEFWKIAVKPGKPVLFGHIDHCQYFGLPGNPVSVMVAFETIVLPALKRLAGESVQSPIRLRVRSQSNIKKVPGRLEFQRGLLHQDTDGTAVVSAFENQASHILRSMVESNCFIVLPADCGSVSKGEFVDVELFERAF